MTRNQQILALRGTHSFGEIAGVLDISRNVVAGVCWRDDWPPATRIRSPNSQIPNKCGTGRRRTPPAEVAA